MSTASLQQMMPRTRLGSKHPAPTSAPQKRKFSTSENTENGKSKRLRPSTMSQHTLAQPADASVSDSTEHYGVFQHYDLTESTSSDTELIATAPDSDTAYTKLCEHASSEIGSHPTWGATYTRTSQTVYEILDANGVVRTRYSIDTMIPHEDGWKREREWLAQDYSDRPQEHWGLYIDLTQSPGSTHTKPETFFLGGYTSLGEAKHAMKTCVNTHLAQYSGVRIMERSIELVDDKGSVRQRYRIVKGRYISGRFVSEEEWVEREMEAMTHGEDAVWETLRSNIKRLPTPTPTPAPEEPTRVSEEPTSAPEEPTSAPEEPTSAPEEPTRASREPTPVPEENAERNSDPEPEQWCTCRTPDDGSLMICCDNAECAVKWYHGRCIGLKGSPRGKWLCAMCKPARVPTARATRAKASSETLGVKEGRVEKVSKGGRKKKRNG